MAVAENSDKSELINDKEYKTRLKRDDASRRSRVRQLVTYWVIAAYLILASVLILWLLWAGRYDLAIGVFSGVGGTAGSIAGFWFGSRKQSTDTAAGT